MRTTVTLDEDVDAMLRAEIRSTGRPFKQVVNEALRASFYRRKTTTPFKVTPKNMGELKVGGSLDKICELVELGRTGKEIVRRLRGTATVQMSTDEILKLTRK
jgi:hypothetical protein